MEGEENILKPPKYRYLLVHRPVAGGSTYVNSQFGQICARAWVSNWQYVELYAIMWYLRFLGCCLGDANSPFLRRGIDGRSGPVLRARGRIV